MAARGGAVNVWKGMKPASLRRLALAAFLTFGVGGLLSVLMESELRPHTWAFVIVQVIGYGGVAASMLLFPRKRWWTTVGILVFWMGILVLNSGGISFVSSDEGFRAHLGKSTGVVDEPGRGKQPGEGLSLTPQDLNAIYTQRAVIGAAAIVLLGFGYTLFIRVIRREAQERSRLETEVAIAKEIQRSLLPQSPLKTGWCEVAGLTIPMTEVGGDYFDSVGLPAERIGVAVADVTGHGVGAGILSSMTKSAFHAELEHDPSPQEVLRNVNRTLNRLSDDKTFVTFAYVLLDRKGGTAAIATAGHPPVLRRDGRTAEISQIRTPSLGLGLRPDAAFGSVTVQAGPGDSFLLYTDGALELTNRAGEQFGIERLTASFRSRTGGPEEVCAGIVSDLRAFSGSEEFYDDVTLVSIHVSSS